MQPATIPDIVSARLAILSTWTLYGWFWNPPPSQIINLFPGMFLKANISCVTIKGALSPCSLLSLKRACTTTRPEKSEGSEFAQSRLSLRCSPKFYIPFSHGLNRPQNLSRKSVRSAEREVIGSILGHDIPKSLKMVLAAPRLAPRFTE